MKVLCFDAETTGFCKKGRHEPYDLANDAQFPQMVQMSWQLIHYDTNTKNFVVLSAQDFIIRPTELYTIPVDSTKIHGITHEHALTHGVPLEVALQQFVADLFRFPDTYILCHNVEYDVPILLHKLFKATREKMMVQGKSLSGYLDAHVEQKCICTMLNTIYLCKLPFANGGRGYKFPTLDELFYTLFREKPKGQLHNSKFDVENTIICFIELLKLGVQMSVCTVKFADTNARIHNTHKTLIQQPMAEAEAAEPPQKKPRVGDQGDKDKDKEKFKIVSNYLQNFMPNKIFTTTAEASDCFEKYMQQKTSQPPTTKLNKGKKWLEEDNKMLKKMWHDHGSPYFQKSHSDERKTDAAFDDYLYTISNTFQRSCSAVLSRFIDLCC